MRHTPWRLTRVSSPRWTSGTTQASVWTYRPASCRPEPERAAREVRLAVSYPTAPRREPSSKYTQVLNCPGARFPDFSPPSHATTDTLSGRSIPPAPSDGLDHHVDRETTYPPARPGRLPALRHSAPGRLRPPGQRIG